MCLLCAQRMSILLSSWCMIAVEALLGDVVCTKKVWPGGPGPPPRVAAGGQ